MTNREPRAHTADPTVESKGNVDANAVRRIGYVPAFDGLRGVGAILVVSVHLFMIVIPKVRGMPQVIPGTFVVMDMFFVLSGFLITALLLREQTDTSRISLLFFYRRRAMRLIPALYVLLAAHFLYAYLTGLDLGLERYSALYAASFLLNWQFSTMVTTPIVDALTPLWSLCVEEQFYVVWPILVILCFNMRRRLSTVAVALVAIIVFVAVRRAWLYHEGANWLRLYTHTDTRADSLLVGALLAFFWVHGKVPQRGIVPLAWLAVAFLTWCLVWVRMDDPFAYRGGFTLMAVAWAVVVLAALQTDWAANRLLSWAPIMLLGEVSYGIYLWHEPLQIAVARYGQEWSPVARVAVSLVLTTAAVWFSWVAVEQPVLRWKDRLERKAIGRTRAGAAAPAPAAPTMGQESLPTQRTA